MCLFNEHFVVKPGGSGIEFRWHTDEDEQLAMLCGVGGGGGGGAARVGARAHGGGGNEYISLWVALDDATAENGCLRVSSLWSSHEVEEEQVRTRPRPCPPRAPGRGGEEGAAGDDASDGARDEDVRDHDAEEDEEEQEEEGEPLAVQAGDCVAFSSRLWHRSGANQTTSPRRAFYAQFSSRPITVGGGAALRLAIPCARSPR